MTEDIKPITEEKAKEKMCPFGNSQRCSCNCLGSDCMMWRETKAAKPQGYFQGVALKSWGPEPAEGYCGLAGRP